MKALTSIMYYVYLCGYTIKTAMMYRLSVFIDMLSAVLAFFVQMTLWQALLSGQASGTTTAWSMVPYIIIVYFISTFTSINIAVTIENSIRDGSILYYLVRPVNYRKYLLCQLLGQNAFKACLNTLILFCISALIYGVYLTESPLLLFYFSVSMGLGILLMFEITYVCGLLAFWLGRTWFVEWFLQAFTIFFGGSAVPLWFYPEFLQKLSLCLPFRYVSYEAINIYLGKYSLEMCCSKILISLLWLAALWLVGRLMWRAAQKRIEINGG